MTGEKRQIRVALVGHCGPDSSALRSAVGRALPGAELVTVNEEKRLLPAAESADVLLINRALDGNFPDADGIEMIRRLAGNPARLMLISNYPEAQARAQEVGAVPGFGKTELNRPATAEKLRAAVAAGRL